MELIKGVKHGEEPSAFAKWAWMMRYCAENGLPPAQTWAWDTALLEYGKREQV